MPWAHWWSGLEGKSMELEHLCYYPTIYVLDAKGVIRYTEIRGEELRRPLMPMATCLSPPRRYQTRKLHLDAPRDRGQGHPCCGHASKTAKVMAGERSPRAGRIKINVPARTTREGAQDGLAFGARRSTAVQRMCGWLGGGSSSCKYASTTGNPGRTIARASSIVILRAPVSCATRTVDCLVFNDRVSTKIHRRGSTCAELDEFGDNEVACLADQRSFDELDLRIGKRLIGDRISSQFDCTLLITMSGCIIFQLSEYSISLQILANLRLRPRSEIHHPRSQGRCECLPRAAHYREAGHLDVIPLNEHFRQSGLERSTSATAPPPAVRTRSSSVPLAVPVRVVWPTKELMAAVTPVHLLSICMDAESSRASCTHRAPGSRPYARRMRRPRRRCSGLRAALLSE